MLQIYVQEVCMKFSEITKALKELSGISSNLQKLEWLNQKDKTKLRASGKWKKKMRN